MATSLSTHKVLRVPRCAVCGSKARYGAVSSEKVVYVPGNPLEQG